MNNDRMSYEMCICFDAHIDGAYGTWQMQAILNTQILQSLTSIAFCNWPMKVD